MKYINIYLYLFLAILIFTACKKEDEYVYPPVITEFLSVESSSTGMVAYLHTDKGNIYTALNGDKIKGLVPDSLYRVYCIYELSGDKSDQATLYTLQSIVSPDPVKANQITGGVKTDPLSIQSVWRSGDYINLTLLILSQDTRKHRFHFIDNSIAMNDGSRELSLTLYHSQGGDTEAYFQVVYLSVPLRNYTNKLFPGDSILFNINTFDGIRVCKLVY